MGSSVVDAARVLRENAQLRRAILSAGLLVSALTTGTPLVMNELKAAVWGRWMSRNSSIVYLLTGLVSIAFGGAFGKWTDAVDRRLAFALVGLMNFIPWYTLLVLGITETALMVSSVATVLAGVTCMTPTGCPMVFTIANDLIPREDREIAFGVSYSLVFLIALIMTLGGVLIMSLRPGDTTAVLLYIVFLSCGFFVVVANLRFPQPDVSGGVECAATDSEESEWSDNSPDRGASGQLAIGEVVLDVSATCLEPSQLWWLDSDVRNLCLVATMLSLPEVALADMSQQFVYTCLGLLPDGPDTDPGALAAAVTSATLQEERSRKQLASAIFTYPGMMVALPAFFIAGIAAKHCSALTLMRVGIPITALLQAFPALLVVNPTEWMVVLSGILLALSGVIFTPVQTVCAEIAPDGAVGESMALVGVAKQAASVLGNLLVFFGVPMLQGTSMDHPLWIFYPLAAVVALSAAWPAARIRRQPSSGAREVVAQEEPGH